MSSVLKKSFSFATETDFLNLIFNANFVLATSFHGTVFSILFNKPFFAINGDKDNRISNLLKLTKLECRTINVDDMMKKEEIAFDNNYIEANELISKERERSINYLSTALGL